MAVCADKSITHRAILLASLASSPSRILDPLLSDDCLATVAAMRQLGVSITRQDNTLLITAAKHWQAPVQPIDCGNSGTLMRLLTGMLAGSAIEATLVGDASLSRRPMQRIITPLSAMGAQISADHGCAPLHIQGQPLTGIAYDIPEASAQVKSALLLAAIQARGRSELSQTLQTRDHTERMLPQFGVACEIRGQRVLIDGGQALQGTTVPVPKDISAAAFFLVAAAVTPNAQVHIPALGVNPTRIGILHILEAMGADLSMTNQRLLGAEPVADISLRYRPLQPLTLRGEWIASAIDEFPAIFAACATVPGQLILSGLAELRHKESDRIAAMIKGLREMGCEIQGFADGVSIKGGILRGAEISSFGDHRIAMAFASLAGVVDGAMTIRDTRIVATSFPNFVSCAQQFGINIEVGTD